MEDNAHLVSNDRVWMDGNALTQLDGVARDPHCVRAVGMPDLHCGAVTPIGAVFATTHISPSLIGGDIGCGATLVPTNRKPPSLDKADRRIRDAFTDVDELRLDLDAVWRDGLGALPEDLHGLADAMGVERTPAGGAALPEVLASDGFARQLGSIGGGNHFAELVRVDRVHDTEQADSIGLVRNKLGVLVHSGSRGLGKAVGRQWPERYLDPDQWDAYLAQMDGAVRFARVNRMLLVARMLDAIGAGRPDRVGRRIDVVHNDVERVALENGGDEVWLHRKGAAPAYDGQLTLVLGSRGANSWVLRGTGNAQGLWSVAHGAGRKLARGEAIQKLRHRYTRAQASRGARGSRLVCHRSEVLFEEHPDAYKPVEPVVTSLIEAGLATPVAELEPLVTVKT
ncbi:MAG: RtcB family protein [Myxococcota bacterium]